MQRTTACSLSYFQPISRLRDLPKQVFGISCGEKCDCASPKRSKRPPLQEKVRSCEFFASQDSHNRTFLRSGGAFPEANRAAKAEAIRRDLSGTRALRSPPQARLRMRPPDTSRRHTLRAHLTNAPSENAREKHNSLGGPKPIAHHAAQSRGRPRAVGQCDRFVQKRRSQAQPSLGKQGERNDGYLCLHERPRLGKHLLRRRSGHLHARQTLCTGGKSRKAPR